MIQPVKCVRLFSDAEGESHFEDFEVAMSSVQHAPPAPPINLSDPVDTTRYSWFRLPADWGDDAHPSPRRQLLVVLDGEMECWTSSGDRRRFTAGECLFMEDTSGKGHGTRSAGGNTIGLVIALE